MKFIKLTDEQKEKYSYLQDLLNLIEGLDKKMTLEEKLRTVEDYLEFCEEYALERYIKGVLLGTNEIPLPEEFEDWTDKEKLQLFDRWSLINRMHTLSIADFVAGKIKSEPEEEDEPDPEKNNGQGLIS